MDLDDLTQWTDEELMEALNEIEKGLTERNLFWIEEYNNEMVESSCLSDRQREVAEDILTQWNERHG